MGGGVALVTDSTASLGPAGLPSGVPLDVVPLHVVLGEATYVEGVDIGAEEVTAALRRGRRVVTSRPSPAALLDAYTRLAEGGAAEIVSAHLPGTLSGTVEAARLAAPRSPVPVHVVDSGVTGLGLGFAVAAGARAAAQGAGGADVARALEEHGARTRTLGYVHSLEQLRRGGRIGAAASLLGNALAVKPLLALVDGRVEPLEKLRTTGRALTRLVELSAAAAREVGGDVAVGVQHVGARARAEGTAKKLGEMLGLPESGRSGGNDLTGTTGGIDVVELPAVLAAHLGPGTVVVAIAPV